jgi:hypothetical protein
MDRVLKFSAHARTMMHERMIQEEWILRAVHDPDTTEERSGIETHYLKHIPDARGKTLRVIVNHQVDPSLVITAFFDRRIQ